MEDVRAKRPLLYAALLTGALFGSALAAAPSALAQDGAQPRQIPKGFVLPGPAPTGGSGKSGETGTAPAAVTSSAEASPAKDASSGREDDVQNPAAFAKGVTNATTDWPCMQRKVGTIETAQVWAGPALPSAGSVSLSPDERRLVDRLVGRRLPLEDAEKLVTDHLRSIDGTEATQTDAKRLMAVLLERFNAERGEVMQGIERYGAKQKALAARLRDQSSKVSKMQMDADASVSDAENARQELLWDTRVFDERRRSLRYVCEVPTLIEQRAFGLGRAISSTL